MTLAEDLLNGINIVDVVGRYVALTKAGTNYKGLCPFHGEKTPSFVVSPHKQIFKCFGCGVGGDAITFVKELERVEFMEAAKILSKDAGINMDDYRDVSYDPKIQDDKERLLQLNQVAANFFVQELSKNKEAQEYVSIKRGLTPEIVKRFGVGYAPDNYYSLTQYLSGKDFDITEQLSGSLAKRQQWGDAYAFYRDRVIFPIYDTRDKIIGFGWRALKPDAQPKYINAADTKVYDKSNVLYGLNRAKSAVREHDMIIVVEWYMDVIALHRLDYPIAVATCGTSLTYQHLKTLKKYTDRIVLLFDQDKAGFEATLRALSGAYKQDIYPQVLILPDQYKDADDLAQAVDAWSAERPNMTTMTRDAFAFVLERLQDKYDAQSPIDKKRLLNDLFELVAVVHSLSIQQHYLSLISTELRMSDPVIVAEFQTYIRDQKRHLQQQMKSHAQQSAGDKKAVFKPSEDELLASLFLDQWIVEQLDDVQQVGLLLQRAEKVAASDRWSLLARTVDGTLADIEQATLQWLQLRWEEERDRYGTNVEKYGLIMQRLGKNVQRLTQTAVKLAAPDQKSAIIQLMQGMRG
jgi:DNA primase